MEIAKLISKASTHPKSPGGCIIVRDREIIGDGRSLLTSSGVEIDCLCYAIAVSSKRGTPVVGANIYTTRYPFSASIFQCYLMGIRKIIVLAHEWEAYYRDEFRRSARLARELAIAIEPLYEDEDERFSINKGVRDFTAKTATATDDDDLYSDANPFAPDDFDPQDASQIQDED